MPALLGLSVLATAAAEAVAYPLYMIKTNLQSQVIDSRAGQGTSQGPVQAVWRMARHIVTTRGPLGLYSGVGIALFKSAPAACITYYVYETAKASGGSPAKSREG